MIVLHGKWSDGRTSTQVDATLRVRQSSAWELRGAESDEIWLEGEDLPKKISARLANTPRHLSFPGQGSFETLDNDGVDALLGMLQRKHWSLWVHLLESRMRYVLIAVIITALLAFVGTRYGVPAAAKLIANHLPEAAVYKAGEQTLAVFDKVIFKPSELEPAREQELRTHLQSAVEAHPGLQLEIGFRKGGHLGPNAFALPSGQIIFTDEMVALAENDNELLAVLVHEIGHVVHHHGIRRLIQDSLLSFAILAVTGDASGVSELFLGLPVVLTELGYSRGFEVEADLYALEYMRAHTLAPHYFADIIERITAKKEKQETEESKGAKWTNYLSTHPATEDRIRRFTEAETAERP